jgi:hypothetical protein
MLVSNSTVSCKQVLQVLTQPASWHDVIFMEYFLEDALADFDRICEGVPVSVVDVV